MQNPHETLMRLVSILTPHRSLQLGDSVDRPMTCTLSVVSGMVCR
jgi:hypothetical protein